MLKSLSGRLLILTTIFVMLAEVLIFVPSIARFREEYMMNRLERAQIASLTLLASDMIDPELEAELLRTAQVFNVVLRRDRIRQLALSSPMSQTIKETYDLRDASAWVLIRDAFHQLAETEPGVIRVIGAPVQDAGLLIEITMEAGSLRTAMIDYGIRHLDDNGVFAVSDHAGVFAETDQGCGRAYAELRSCPRGCATNHFAFCWCDRGARGRGSFDEA